MTKPSFSIAAWRSWASGFVQQLRDFPWRNTLATLGERFREDRLGLTASSLTFTTTIGLVPLFTVLLALFSAFPVFAKVQLVLQQWLLDSLVPEAIAKQVIGYILQFSAKASKLGVAGLGVILITAVALILTIDRTLNSIWRVRRPRPLAQRILVYWAGLTLGPLLLGSSLALTSLVISASKGLVGALPGGVGFLIDLLQFVMVAGGMAALYRYVPHTEVRWSHAWTGGFFVAVGLELTQKLLGMYLKAVPTYSLVYGAFATVPILLIWIYLVWVIVLLGAVVAAYLPALLAGVARRGGHAGWHFELALEVVAVLQRRRASGRGGISGLDLAAKLHLDPLQLEVALSALAELDWIGRLDEDEPRYVLLCEPSTTDVGPLAKRLLLENAALREVFLKGGPLISVGGVGLRPQ